MWYDYGLTWSDAVRIVLSSVGLYILVLIFMRSMGQRIMSNLSTFDIAAVVAFGAIIGRAILGYTPTLVSGVLALATLLSLQALTGLLRRFRRGEKIINNDAYLLMSQGEIITEHLRRTHVSEREIAVKLRQSGVRNFEEVACVILEPTGAISVLRAGSRIDPKLLEHVRGAELIPRHLIADSGSAG